MTQTVNIRYRPSGPVGARGRLNLRYFNFGLLALIAAFGVFYLVNINDLTIQGFALQNLKSQAAALSGERAENEELANSIQSYYSLNERTQTLNMVAIDQVEYLAVNRSAVAKR